MINKLDFRINFPLKILRNKKIDFEDLNKRRNVLKRNIYYQQEKNNLLEKRSETYYILSKKIWVFLGKRYPNLKILSISVFGSSLFSNNFSDYDFLVITSGNRFMLKEEKINLNGKYIPVGISIKGIENLSYGVIDNSCEISYEKQKEIIYRTSSTLFRRHVPILGYDFVYNKEEFFQNILPLVSDLLKNSYDLYYLNKNQKKLTFSERSKKILSRIYEAVHYIGFLEESSKLLFLKRKIYFSREEGATFSESMQLFHQLLTLYKEILKNERSKNG